MFTGPDGVSTTTYIDMDSRAVISYEIDPVVDAATLFVNDGRDVHLTLTRQIIDRCIEALTEARTELDKVTTS